MVDYDELMALFKTRRTIRDVKTDPIPDELVEKVLEAARWAPSGFNMQPWEFVVVREPRLRAGIVDIINDYRTNEFFMYEATREEWQGPKWVPDLVLTCINQRSASSGECWRRRACATGRVQP